MSTYCNHHMEGYKSSGGPTTELDVHIKDIQMEYMQPTNVYLRKYCILIDAGGQGAKLNVVMQKLDSFGYIQGCCGFLTDPDRVNIVRHHIDLADSIAEIKRVEDYASAEKKG